MNAKIKKTKQALLEAFCTLAESTPTEEISVSQLCKEAGINRTTFYRYYSIPLDVIIEAVEELTVQTLYSEGNLIRDSHELMLTLCNTFYNNRNLVALYTRANADLMHVFYQVMIHRAGNLGFLAAPINKFIAGGVAGTIMTWIMQGCAEPPEKVAQYLTDCISKLTAPPITAP